MVKKILKDGSPCGKCAQAEDILRKRNLLSRIGRTVTAYENDPDSEGMKLSAQHGIDLAPFFIVEDDGTQRIYTRIFEFIKQEFEGRPATGSGGSFTPEEADTRYASMEPGAILAEAQNTFGEDLTLAFSGAEDVILIDLAAKNSLPFSVFCLDTGRLHGETCAFLDQVREHYGIQIDFFHPQAAALEEFLNRKGMNSFYQEGHSECCRIRKVEPLGRALSGRRAWATGLRRDQNPSTRADLKYAEYDDSHQNTNAEPLIKINPVLDWTSEQVWNYIRENQVPYNPLHDAGYRSVGCQPCSRPSRPGEHEREARWWWENEARECGLHVKQ